MVETVWDASVVIIEILSVRFFEKSECRRGQSQARRADPRSRPEDPTDRFQELKKNVRGTTAPLTKLGTVVVTVERMLVPNCSEAMVTNTAQ